MFDWAYYLQLAEQLGNDKGDEARLRTAVSRAYYAAYHIARVYVEEVKLQPADRREPHASIWRAFEKNRPGVRSEEYRIQVNGFRLRDYRVDADYKPGASQFDRTVVVAIQLARRIVADIQALRKN